MGLRFLSFELRTEQRDLLKDGEPVAIAPKAFDVLSYLATHHARVVPKSELMETFWSTQSSEAALQKTISQVRKALAEAAGTGAGARDVIKTYHGRGFRFVAPLETTGPATPGAPPANPLREARRGTVLCVRLRPATRNEAEATAFMQAAKTMLEQYQGHLLHTLIDGFTAAFGLDPYVEDSARRAVHCAEALRTGATFPITCGIDSGGLSQDGLAQDDGWALPGEIERKATTLADAGAAGEIMLSAAVRDQMRDEIEVVQEQAGLRLTALVSMPAGIPGRPRKRPVRFIGRRPEMTFLATQANMLAGGTGQAVLLSGPPGIGKTRLMSEFLASLDCGTAKQVKVQCLPALINTAFAPVRALCAEVFPDTETGALADPVEQALWAEMTGTPSPSSDALQSLSDHKRRTLGAALFARRLTESAEDAPLVLAIEDVHWIDESSRACLAALLEQIDRRRIMVVMTTRPVEAPPRTETVLHVSPLGHGDSLALLTESCDEVALPQDRASDLAARAEGNPFFLEELALAAQTGQDPARELPHSVQSVIALRVEALPVPLRALVYVISVIGPPAPVALIRHLLGQDLAALERDIASLVQSGFLQDEGGAYSFRHMLIQDTAYGMLAAPERRRLHAQVATYLEAQEGGARFEALAWHHQEAGHPERAIGYWIKASRAALHRSARSEAIAFAESGLALIGGDDAESDKRALDLLLCLAPALTALRGFGAEEVGTAYAHADTLNRRVRDVKSEIRVQVGLWIHTWVRGRLTQSLAHADRLLGLAAKIPDPALVLQAHASRGQVLMHQGALQPSLDALRAALGAIYDAPPDTLPTQNAAVSCAAYAAWVAQMMGHDDEAAAHLAQSRDLALSQENPYARAIHYALCTETFMTGGDVAGCLDYADQAIAVSREHDFAFWLGTGLAMRGWACGQQGDFAAGFAALEEGIAVFEATGAGVQLANWHGLLAETQLAADEPETALARAAHAIDCAERAEDLWFTPRIHAVAAGALERLGRPQEAAAHLEAARRRAASFGMAARVYALS